MEKTQNTSKTPTVDVKFKNRISLVEFGSFVDEAVESCFSYDEILKSEVYDPTFLDFKMKTLFVKYYSNYADAIREKLSEVFANEPNKVEEEVSNVNTLYDFCCGIQMTGEYFKSIGVDFAQYTRLAVAIEDRISHKMRIIESKAGFVEIINKINEAVNTVGELAETFVSGINDNNVTNLINEFKDEFSMQNLVDTYSKSEIAKKNKDEVEQAKRQRRVEKDKAVNIVQMTNYKDINEDDKEEN